MRPAAFLICLSLLLPLQARASFFDDDTPPPCSAASGATLEPVFSAHGGFSAAIVRAIGQAKKSLRIAALNFNSKTVAEAVIKAQRSGVDVRIVFAKRDAANVYSAADLFRAMSMNPHITNRDDTLFSDYIVIDDRDVVLGNVAVFADEEEEQKKSASALIVHNAPDLAKRYLADWQALWDASRVMPDAKN